MQQASPQLQSQQPCAQQARSGTNALEGYSCSLCSQRIGPTSDNAHHDQQQTRVLAAVHFPFIASQGTFALEVCLPATQGFIQLLPGKVLVLPNVVLLVLTAVWLHLQVGLQVSFKGFQASQAWWGT